MSANRATVGPLGGRLIRDDVVERQLRDEGFVRLDLFSAAEIDELRSVHDRLHPFPGRGFDTDFAYVSPEHKSIAHESILRVVEPVLSRVFEPVRMFNVTFVVKWPGEANHLPVHQDWAYVDERVDRTCTVWIPLDDTAPERGNGALGVLPRSHLLPPSRRGANSHSWYLPYRDQLAEHLELQTVGAGQTLVLDGRLLHGSPDNVSDAPRRAVTVMVAPAAAQLRYHHVDGDVWKIFEIGERFFVDNGPIDLRLGRPRGGRLVAVEPATSAPIPRRELREFCGIEIPETDDRPSPALHLAGSPLGPDRPTGDPPSLVERLVHRLNRLDRGDRVGRDPVLRRLGPAAAAWYDATPALHERSSHEAVVRGTEGGWTGREVPLREIPPEIRRLANVRGCWLFRVGAGSVRAPRRSGANDSLLVFVAVHLRQPPGNVLVQAHERLVAADRGVAVLVDPTEEHATWNFGPAEAVVLAFEVARPSGRALTGLARALRRAGVLPAYDPGLT